MSADKIVHFVFFDTKLDSDQFITKWQEYTRSANIDKNVTIQQSEKESGFRYIAQHRGNAGELKFVFEKARRSSRIRQVEIISKLAGGYSIIYAEKTGVCEEDEIKIFAFLAEPSAELEIFKQLSEKSKLNIYEAYYENCRYACILEFFVKNEYAADFLEQLHRHDTIETGIYKECELQLL